MKATLLLTQLLLNVETVQAFSPSIQRSTTLTRQSQPSSRVFSQWDDEDDEVAKGVSFDEAGVALTDAEDQKRIAEMGDDGNEEVSYVGDSVSLISQVWNLMLTKLPILIPSIVRRR